MKYELTKNVSFLKPFLKGVGKIVPLAKLTRIKGYRVAKGLEEQKHAGIVEYDENTLSHNPPNSITRRQWQIPQV